MIQPVWRLWWEIARCDDGLLRLQILVPPTFPQDSSTRAALDEARRLTDRHSGGWLVAWTKGQIPELPWNPDQSPAEHACEWARLLQRMAKSPE